MIRTGLGPLCVVVAAFSAACSQGTGDTPGGETSTSTTGSSTTAGSGQSASANGSSGAGGGAATSGSGGATTGDAASATVGATTSSATTGNGATTGSGATTTSGATTSAGATTSSSSSSGGSTAMQPFKGVANSPCAARTALNVSWYYNWEQTETEACTGGQGGEFIPMIWGHTGAEQTASKIQSAVASFVSGGHKYVLGFNEPDNTGQSNISVATAISLLPSFDNPAILVGTPASQANASGQTWFKDYMGQVNASTTLRADFIAIHWYGWNAGSCDAKASQLESYIKYAEGFAGNRPIWLTEWGCLNDSAPTTAGVVAFYQGAVAVFARHPRVQRYAWYPWSTNCELNNDDGSLTSLGVAYAAAAAYH